MTSESSLRATSADVARLAGFSRATVSHILNGHDARFPQETRDRVAAAAAQLRYRPSAAGRALVTGVSDLLLVVVPNVTIGPRLQQVIERITEAAAELGRSALVRYVGSEVEPTITSILDLRPAGVFHLGALDAAAIRRIEATGTPVLPGATLMEASALPVDRFIGRLQAEELLRVPTSRLIYAMHADERVGSYGEGRARGVADYAESIGAAAPLRVDVSMRLSAARAALDPLLRNPHPRVAVACYNDDVAMAVLAVGRQMGLRTEHDIAVVGVDRTDSGQLASPRLTTVEVDIPAIGESFVRALRRLHAGDTEAPPTGADAADVTPFIRLVPGETS